MRYYVTGATGYIGRRLLVHLSRLGHQVFIGAHSASRSFLLPCGVAAATTAQEPCRGALDAVIHLAYAPTLGTRAALGDNLRAADDVIQLAGVHGARLIHASTIAVAGYQPPAGFAFGRVVGRPAQDDTYTYVKGRVERHVVAECRRRGVPLSVIRIGNVMGPGSVWACALVARATATEGLDGYSNSTGIGNLIPLVVEESLKRDPLRFVLSTEFASVSWHEWLTRMGGRPDRGAEDADPWPTCGSGRRSLAAVDSVKTLVKRSPMLSAAFNYVPAGLLSRAVREFQVPATEPVARSVYSPVEAAIFSCPVAVPERGCRAVSLEVTLDAIRRWAAWAEFVPATGGAA